MDLWIPAHRAANGAAAPLTMGFLARADLPFYYALADAFTICDNYHCSVMGPTHPNRYYAMSATIDPEGRHGGPAIDNTGQAYTWETYPERLQKAGISWRIYHDLDDYGCNVCKYFVQYRTAPKGSPLREAALRNRPFYELLWDLRTGKRYAPPEPSASDSSAVVPFCSQKAGPCPEADFRGSAIKRLPWVQDRGRDAHCWAPPHRSGRARFEHPAPTLGV